MKNLKLARKLRREKVAEASNREIASYFGPVVEAGYSYGSYVCSSCGFEQISNLGETIHCVNCGNESELNSKISYKEVNEVISSTVTEFNCTVCGTKTITSSASAIDEDCLFCPQCSSVTEKAEKKNNGVKEMKNILVENDYDVEFVKDEEVENAEIENEELEIAEEDEDEEIDIEEDEDMEDEDEDEDMEDEDEDMEDEDEDEDMEDEDEDEDEDSIDINITDEDDAIEEIDDIEEDEDNSYIDIIEDEDTEDEEDEEDEDTEDEEDEDTEDEEIDEDMLCVMKEALNKKVKDKKDEDKDDKVIDLTEEDEMEEEATAEETNEEEAKEEETTAEETNEEETATEETATEETATEETATEETATEETATEETATEETEEEATSTDFVSVLTPVEESASYVDEDIQMAFYQSNDPSWTVLIKGEPIAKISLSDQKRADEIADMFISDEYAQNVAQAMVQCGVKEVLSQVNAKFFINKIEKDDLAVKMAEKARADLEDDFKVKVASLHEDFKSSIAVVLAGMNKNFWRGLDNPLKASLFSNLKDLGVSDPSQVIESAFSESADSYFEIVLNKAIDFMNKTPETREEIAKTITEANTITNKEVKNRGIPEGKQLTNKLVSNNIVARFNGNLETNSDKETIKNAIRLGKNYSGK